MHVLGLDNYTLCLLIIEYTWARLMIYKKNSFFSYFSLFKIFFPTINNSNVKLSVVDNTIKRVTTF